MPGSCFKEDNTELVNVANSGVCSTGGKCQSISPSRGTSMEKYLIEINYLNLDE